ncbi:type II secretion system F family protein [Haloechinothrix salitolerans]|uniref:Type II secretion system F family protein n=1 Tax=Haloechinothrix salitolerans TaxID=926830 RepID=A0ABW2BX48_9PSEU
MSVSTMVAGVLGTGFGLGVLLLIRGMRGQETTTPVASGRWARWVNRLRHRSSARGIALSVTSGVLVGVFTGWVVGGVLSALAVWALPRVLGHDTEQAYRVARTEAIAVWTEMLRDTLSAAAGLEQAIHATVDTAPASIRGDIYELSVRLQRGDRLADALDGLADDLNDPTADLVVSALILASQYQTSQLSDLLGELATEAREQVSMRLRVDAERARTRTSVRMIVATTLFLAGGLVVFNRGLLHPYDSAFGQLMLLVVGGLFAAAFAWLAKIARIGEPERFLTSVAGAGPRGGQEIQL